MTLYLNQSSHPHLERVSELPPGFWRMRLCLFLQPRGERKREGYYLEWIRETKTLQEGGEGVNGWGRGRKSHPIKREGGRKVWFVSTLRGLPSAAEQWVVEAVVVRCVLLCMCVFAYFHWVLLFWLIFAVWIIQIKKTSSTVISFSLLFSQQGRTKWSWLRPVVLMLPGI